MRHLFTTRFGKLSLALIFTASVAGQAANAQVKTFEAIKSEGTIRIANTQTSPPWSALDNNNQPAGYDVDVAREVAKRMGLKVVFVGDSWNNFVQGLKSGKYDLVMCDLTPTPERAKQVDFSVPYGVEDFRIWVNEKNSTVRSPSDLAGKKVGVVTGTSNEVWSRSHLKNSIFVDYDNDGLLFSDLANGRIDATIQSHFGGLAQRDSNHLPVKEVGEPLTFQLSAAAMNKGNSALQNSVNRAVSEMLADGTIDRLGKKWVGSNYQMARYIKKGEEERN
ncbi:transporter substrate-binding domain-containing protein [Burkholderia seminalis]|uniref:transporter substrate-binding domain-containing protein n=1 Tax=Burkholderia seminalis TaxID=488731 RepID=UPI0026524B8F|nr:transporter substrate-binding domain-containing protein [Burkholderia seminalis]MDN7591569.1 transporter substrate-binding domain-containing protein [Burkholderia seminalis]